jgi:hypothetical protein
MDMHVDAFFAAFRDPHDAPTEGNGLATTQDKENASTDRPVPAGFWDYLKSFGPGLVVVLAWLLGVALWCRPNPLKIFRGVILFEIPSVQGAEPDSSFAPLLIVCSLIGAVAGSINNLLYPYFLAQKGWPGIHAARGVRRYSSFIVGVLLFGLCSQGFGQGAGTNDILKLEKARFAAMVKKDIATLEKIISDELYYIHSNGEIDTKQSFIAAIVEGRRRYDDITIEKAKVRIYGTTAIINGECIYHRKDANRMPDNLMLRYTNVYARQDGRWQMVSWQSFRISP